MSSDPIEVLRELVQRWRKEESRHEEGMNSVDPAVSNYHEGMSQAFGECADELESALASLSAPKPESAEAVAYKPQDGEPPAWFDEWFIATLDTGERVVLRRLPKEYTYDYTTADQTYYAARRLRWWMQFPDSEYVQLESTAPPRPEARAPIRLRVIFPDGLVQFAPADTRPGYFEGLGCTVLPIHSEDHLAAELKANERQYAAPQKVSDEAWLLNPRTLEAKAQWDAVARALGADVDDPDAVLAAAKAKQASDPVAELASRQQPLGREHGEILAAHLGEFLDEDAPQQASAPVGVEVASLPALWRKREDNGEERTEFDKGYEQASDECAEALERALAQQPAARRQYFYKGNNCPADGGQEPNCICWHDEGTGPLVGQYARYAKHWRDKPQQPAVVDEAVVDRALSAVENVRGYRDHTLTRDDIRAALTAALAQQPAADPLVEWANTPLNFTATVGVFKDGVQPAVVDEARDLIGALQVAELALRERGLQASGEYRQIEATLAKYASQQQGGTPE